MGIPIKNGFCIDCTDKVEKPLTAKRCSFHYWNYRASLKPIKIKAIGKPIPKFSSKQLEQLKKYRKIRDAFMANKKCEAQLDGCSIKATDLHHAKGKIGDLLTDQRYFKALCRNCHSYLEVHPDEAKEKGFSLSRLKTETI